MSKKSFSFPSVMLSSTGDVPGGPGPGSGMGGLSTGGSMMSWSDWQANYTLEGFDPRNCWDEYVSWWLTQGLDEDAFRSVNGGIGFADAPVVDVISTENIPEA